MPPCSTSCRRARLATLPTPLERGPLLPGGARLWVKRDDLTGLGAGGNKARKLEFLCGEALAAGARSLVTVGAAQSNHCRMTAAAGAVLGLEVHLVLSGDRPGDAGRQPAAVAACSAPSCTSPAPPTAHWGELEIAREELTDELPADGAAPSLDPDRRAARRPARSATSPPSSSCMRAVRRPAFEPAAIVHTSSSGGTHAGLVAGRALRAAAGQRRARGARDRRGQGRQSSGVPDVVELAGETLDADRPARPRRRPDDVRHRRPLARRRTTPCRPSRRRGDPLGGAARRLGARPRRTAARAWPACWATPPPAAGRRQRRRVHPHGRRARRLHPWWASPCRQLA